MDDPHIHPGAEDYVVPVSPEATEEIQYRLCATKSTQPCRGWYGTLSQSSGQTCSPCRASPSSICSSRALNIRDTHHPCHKLCQQLHTDRCHWSLMVCVTEKLLPPRILKPLMKNYNKPWLLFKYFLISFYLHFLYISVVLALHLTVFFPFCHPSTLLLSGV